MEHLSTEERFTIQHMNQQGKSSTSIGMVLSRATSSITRELRRNALQDGSYSAVFAESTAKVRAKDKLRRSAMTPEVCALVEQGLESRFSPEQIIGRQAQQDNGEMPCIQTLYNHIRANRKAGGKLHKRLRLRGRRRKPHGQGKQRRSIIPNRRDISERPIEVEQRQRFGDFECDLIIGAGHSGVILTVNDRVSGLLWMEKLKDKQATTVSKALIRLLKPLKGKIHTLTSDNGTEFVLHEEVSKQLECQCFFAKPYHSWERGSNENLNGLIRDYFPKQIEFYDITVKQIKETQEALNNRPRKRHNFLTPNEFNQQNFKQIDTRCISN
jgi:IS30 family transposase